MTIDAGTITLLVFASLVLGLLAVVLDRVNFPQKPFYAKRIRTGPGGARRDRTGAHIIDTDEPTDGDQSHEQPEPPPEQ